MKKTKKLYSLTRDVHGYYIARWYDAEKGIFSGVTFIMYPKKEVLYLLRNKYGCIVSRGF